jgi:hypothetical protein
VGVPASFRLFGARVSRKESIFRIFRILSILFLFLALFSSDAFSDASTSTRPLHPTTSTPPNGPLPLPDVGSPHFYYQSLSWLDAAVCFIAVETVARDETATQREERKGEKKQERQKRQKECAQRKGVAAVVLLVACRAAQRRHIAIQTR